jgi:hypothetical protein
MMVRLLVTMRVGAALWIEWCLYFDYIGAEVACHLGYDVIAPDAQRGCEYLRSNVPIAQVPSNAGGLQPVRAADLQKRFRRGNNFDQPSVLQDQRIPAVQLSDLRQIK